MSDLNNATEARVAAIAQTASDAMTTAESAQTIAISASSTASNALENATIAITAAAAAAIPLQTSAPGSPATGALWIDTSGAPPQLKMWSGSAWLVGSFA